MIRPRRRVSTPPPFGHARPLEGIRAGPSPPAIATRTPSARRPRVSRSPRNTTPGTPIPSTVNPPATPSRGAPTDPTLLTATVCTPAPFDVQLPVLPSVCTSTTAGFTTIKSQRSLLNARPTAIASLTSMFFFAAKRRTFSSVSKSPVSEQQSDELTADRVQSLTS